MRRGLCSSSAPDVECESVHLDDISFLFNMPQAVKQIRPTHIDPLFQLFVSWLLARRDQRLFPLQRPNVRCDSRQPEYITWRGLIYPAVQTDDAPASKDTDGRMPWRWYEYCMNIVYCLWPGVQWWCTRIQDPALKANRGYIGEREWNYWTLLAWTVTTSTLAHHL